MRKLVALAVLLGMTACSTTTTISSSPPGAKVYLDGIYRGDTPLTLNLPDGSDHGYKHVRLELEGYPPVDTAIGRVQDGTRVICGYLCLFPLLWVYKWDSQYSFAFDAPGASSTAPAGGFAPPPQQPPPPSGSGTQL